MPRWRDNWLWTFIKGKTEGVGCKNKQYDANLNGIVDDADKVDGEHATDIVTNSRVKAHFPDTIANILSDHSKANHDSLNIDADTVDGAHKTDLENTMDSKISSHGSNASAHHSKTTSITELTDHNKTNHDSLGIDADTVDGKHADEVCIKIPTSYEFDDSSVHIGTHDSVGNRVGIVIPPTKQSITGVSFWAEQASDYNDIYVRAKVRTLPNLTVIKTSSERYHDSEFTSKTKLDFTFTEVTADQPLIISLEDDGGFSNRHCIAYTTVRIPAAMRGIAGTNTGIDYIPRYVLH